MPDMKIGDVAIGQSYQTYFIADIGANHDGDLERAKQLISFAKEAGAQAAKFQNFHADRIVSDVGFRAMADLHSHQSNWQKSVFEVYQDASIPDEWTTILKAECDKVGIEYFSSPYDFQAVDVLDPYVRAYKIGSGDIDWWDLLKYIASKAKPVILATGASAIGDVQLAMEQLLAVSNQLVLMQCNTNYTGADGNFDHIHLNVLKTYASMYPNIVLGLSDHTPGHSTVLGAVALGARVIEKHFTDDNARSGPDHAFAMNPVTWREMVDRTRELERAMGSTRKFIAGNEKETRFVQRRCLRAATDIEAGTRLSRDLVDVLRPATNDGIRPPDLDAVLGLTAAARIQAGTALTWKMLTE